MKETGIEQSTRHTETAMAKCENKMKKRASNILNQKKLTIIFIITQQQKGEWPKLASTINNHT